MEYEQIGTLATVQEIRRVTWDAMDQYIVIEAMLGKTPEQMYRTAVALTPPAALELLLGLSECIQEKPPAAGTKQ